jgi:hypothetical protein
MTKYQNIIEDSTVRYTTATIAKDITGKGLSIFWGFASWTVTSLLSNYFSDEKGPIEQNDICASLCPEEIDVKPYVLAGVVGGVSLGMAIMYCAQRKQPSTQITYNVQNNFQIISKNDQIIDR